MLIIGLTGQTGAGKSTVCDYLRAQGYAAIDCDRVSREVTEPGEPCLNKLAAEFSAAVLRTDGSLDRRALGRIVFADRQKLNRLNEIIFPHILRRIDEKLDALRQEGESVAILDAPTLFESGTDRQCDLILAVLADREVRLARIMARDGLTREDALHRMDSQLNEAFFRSHADFILENNGSEQSLPAGLRRADQWIKEHANGHFC